MNLVSDFVPFFKKITCKTLNTLVSLIDVLAWISVLRGNFLKSNKRPVLNKCPGTKIFSEFSVPTSSFLIFFSHFDISCLNQSYIRKYLKNNNRPAPNKGVLEGKLTQINKNVLDYYSGDKSTWTHITCDILVASLMLFGSL